MFGSVGESSLHVIGVGAGSLRGSKMGETVAELGVVDGALLRIPGLIMAGKDELVSLRTVFTYV